jgi:hypothetical protein
MVIFLPISQILDQIQNRKVLVILYWKDWPNIPSRAPVFKKVIYLQINHLELGLRSLLIVVIKYGKFLMFI